MSLKFSSLADTSLATIAQTFNAAFANYFVPIQLTATTLRQKIVQDDIKLELSVGAFMGEQLVGFILHGLRTQQGKLTAYNGGTGVLPTHRGQRLTQRMYAYCLPTLQHLRTSKILLEVITANERAQRTYKKIGFNTVRNLDCWKRTEPINAPTINLAVQIQQIHPVDWQQLSALGEIRPAWQYDATSLQNTAVRQHFIGAYHQQQLIGYLIIKPNNSRIGQLAVAKQWRRKGVGSALLQTASRNYTLPLTFINVDSKHNVFPTFLRSNGFHLDLQQQEMELIIQPS